MSLIDISEMKYIVLITFRAWDKDENTRPLLRKDIPTKEAAKRYIKFISGCNEAYLLSMEVDEILNLHTKPVDRIVYKNDWVEE